MGKQAPITAAIECKGYPRVKNEAIVYQWPCERAVFNNKYSNS